MEDWPLTRLLAALAEVPELKRLRYTTSHPNDMTEELILAHRDNPALMPFLHLPVQSGSDKILTAMNRKHKADDFRRIVARLREVRPDMAFTSDFIIGHPGETDADFAATMALVRETGFALAYSFDYLPRPGTPAAGLPQLDQAVKDARLYELQAELRRQQDALQRRHGGADHAGAVHRARPACRADRRTLALRAASGGAGPCPADRRDPRRADHPRPIPTPFSARWSLRGSGQVMFKRRESASFL